MKRKIFSKLLMGAFLIASVSMFVSCKDYDDDIQKNSQEIEALKAKLNSDIASAKSDLTDQLNKATASFDQLKKDIAEKASAGDVEAIKKDVEKLKGLAEQISGLEALINGLPTAEDLAKKADQADLEKLSGEIKAINGKLLDETKVKEIAEAVVKTLAVQKEAFESFEEKLKDLDKYLTADDLTELKKQLEDLGKLLTEEKAEKINKLLEKDLLTKDEMDEAIKKALEKEFEDLDKKISDAVGPELVTIQQFITKKLTSIVLKPNFYWEGIEGIEAPFIYQTPEFEEKAGYDFEYKLTDAPAGKDVVKVHVDTVMKWKGYDAKVRELGEFVFAGPNAAHADFPDYATAGTGLTYNMTATNNKPVSKLDIMYGAIARYNLNPSNADIEGATIGFYENHAPVYTRATNDNIDPTVVGTPKPDANGLLVVPFTVNKQAVMKYFVEWTNSQSADWEGKAGANLEDWSKLWYYTKADKSAWKNGIDDKDAANDANIFNENLPFVALKIDVPVNEEKGVKEAYTVNSDWAVVVPGLYQIVALADKAPNEALDQSTFLWQDNSKATKPHEIRKNHLYETVGYSSATLTSEDAKKTNQKWNQDVAYGAIPMPATHEVQYDGSIDLLEYVQTHVNYLTFAQYGKSKYDEVLDDMKDADGNSLMKNLGLEYRFKAIDYYVGDEKTSESAHIEQDAEKPSVFYPRSVTDEGKTIKGEKATREVVDREPLIRVDLVWVEKKEDGSTVDHIIRYGYIKLRIVEEAATLYDQEVAIDLDQDLYLNCGDEAKITWSQVENLILAKLGTKDESGKAAGMTKNEFEKEYKLDVYGNYKCMPFIDPTKFTDEITGKTAAALGDNAGTLYTKTWQAKRYYKKAGDAPTKEMKVAKAGDYTAAIDGDYTECDDDSVTISWTTKNNHFGEIWYTPHDNATEGHNWDEKTNVLIWNLYPGDGTAMDAYRKTYSATALTKAQAGGMDNEKYLQLAKLTGANYKTKGISQEPISTVVRFINKKTGRSLWVTLNIPKLKLHFAYADINNRVLDHWYDFKTGYKDNTPDTIEVYANVPTPAEVDRATGVTVNGFKKDLTEYWLNQNIVKSVTFHDGGKFSEFVTPTAPNATTVTFRFRLPEKGVNADFSADSNGQWTVPGASGATWTLELNAAKTEIVAVKKNGTAYTPNTVICTLTPAGVIHWMGRTEEANLRTNGAALAENLEDVNEPANDILNYIGMYDKKGDMQKNYYLSGQMGKDEKWRTFAAYVEVFVHNGCYDPFMGRNYFNVRFLRPINVWPAETAWVDAPNDTQVYEIWRLTNIRDWRTYAVVLDGQKQKLDDSNITYQGIFADGDKASVPYSFYNIKNIYVERAAITSDAYLQPSQRVITDDPSKLKSIDEIPALTGKNTDGSVKWEYLKIMAKGTDKITAGKTAVGMVESTQCGDILAYTNNGGVVKPFHVYVPVAVVYSHGALKPWTQTVYAIITIDPTVGNE